MQNWKIISFEIASLIATYSTGIIKIPPLPPQDAASCHCNVFIFIKRLAEGREGEACDDAIDLRLL
jgi:hypothetical protein